MKSALRLELQQLEGLPFIAGIIWAALIGISLIAITFFYFRNLSKKPSKEKIESQRKISRPEGF